VGTSLVVIFTDKDRVVRVQATVERVGASTIALRRGRMHEISQERREAPRAVLRVRAEYRRVAKPVSQVPSFLAEEDTRPDGPWRPCRIEDISETGALLKTDDVLAIGSLVYIRLTLPFLGTAILLGRAVRIIPPGDAWGYGVKFECVSEGDKLRIAEYAASQAQESSGAT
jgi:hypothetical protein